MASLPNSQQFGLHNLACLRIESRERLVHQQDFWIYRKRSSEVDALSHAARELPRIVVLEALQADELQELERPLALVRADRSATSRPMMALANTVRHGRSASFWNTKPRSMPGWCTRLPSSEISPVVADSRPATIRKKVILPQPPSTDPTETVSAARTSSVSGSHLGCAHQTGGNQSRSSAHLHGHGALIPTAG